MFSEILLIGGKLLLEKMKRDPSFKEEQEIKFNKELERYEYEHNKRRDDPTRDDDLVANLRDDISRNVKTIYKKISTAN